MMRQEDNFDEFDLKVRNLLENAEETVPPCVWDAVSSRLDRRVTAGHSSIGRKPSRRIVWAAASFAFAAVMAIGLLLPHDFEEDAVIPSQTASEQELLAAGSLPLPADESPSILSTGSPLACVAPSGLGKSSVQQASSPEQVDSSPVQADSLSVQAETSAGQECPLKQPASPSSSAKEPSYSDDSLIAVADWGAGEDSDRLLRRFSMGLEGTLNVNDSRISNGRDFRSYMTSGTSSHTVTSIEEGSVSAYDIPLSFGLTVRYQFAPRFSVGTGITYSLTGRTFSGTYYEVEGGIPTRQISGDIRHTMHYLGIPVNFYFDFVQSKAINCYVYAGGVADFCVSNKYSIEDVVFSDPVNSPQFSIGAGLGVQFRLSKLIGLYIDPGVRYYFRCDQPKSIRTDQPFMVNFEAGLRFNL